MGIISNMTYFSEIYTILGLGIGLGAVLGSLISLTIIKRVLSKEEPQV